ncbi:hypothetical protein EAX61_09930 [Dokdonia sinensis]|uniref:Copper-binding protein MbnP-like domain-containing protein n=1 Tax=Dokdonia sinensis TaxID=2479847 RepID=A0A3M0GMU6_9FLAO|nr:MbnP family protein [Dokdonia sinensis]RMB58606.1 hypothetical protein EAX61_09930 [Dokdonia sinensis]
MKKICLLILSTCILLSCDSDDNTNREPGSLELRFENKIGSENLILGTPFTNSSNEQYVVNELKYIISNITLTRKDGSQFIYPVADSYAVVNEEESSSKMITLTNIDAGTYDRITFGFGVDPTKYPIESGTLNFVPTAEEAGMLWSWSAGYKFIKMEGTYTPENGTESNDFVIHVGSHGANLDNYKEIELAIGEDIKINSATASSKIISFDVSQVFNGANTIRLEDKADIQVDPINAPKIAQNIQAAFSIN